MDPRYRDRFPESSQQHGPPSNTRGQMPSVGMQPQPYYHSVRPSYVSASAVIARQDRIHVWSLPYYFVAIIGIGSLFTFFDISDINVSFIQTCVQIVDGCHAVPDAVRFLGLPVLFNLAGYVVGALLLSPLADRLGRRDMLLVTLLLTGLGSLYTASVGDYPSFIFARTITGIGVGADLAIVNTYINEVSPRNARAKYTSLILILSGIGSCAALWLGLLFTTPPEPFPYGLPFALAGQHLEGNGWRILYGIGAILALIGIVVRAQLPESPRWLVSRGRIREADAVVRAMEDHATRAMGNLPSAMDELPVRTDVNRPAFSVILRDRTYLKRTVLLLLVWLTGYVTVYSYSAGFTSILGSLGYGASEAGLIVAVGISGFLLSSIVCYFLCERLERKLWLPIAALLTLIGGLLIAGGGQLSSGQGAEVVAFAGSIIINFGLIWLGPTYAWSSENFPTRARTTGFGIVDGVGHIGGGIGVLLIAPVLPHLGPLSAFLLIGVFVVVAAIIAQFGTPTRGKRLDMVSP